MEGRVGAARGVGVGGCRCDLVSLRAACVYAGATLTAYEWGCRGGK
jgi:hypothetical protein